MTKTEILETIEQNIKLELGIYGVTWEMNKIHHLYLAVVSLKENLGQEEVMQEFGEEYKSMILKMDRIGKVTHTINWYYGLADDKKVSKDDITTLESRKFRRAVEELPPLPYLTLYTIFIRLVKHSNMDNIKIHNDVFQEAERKYHKIEFKPEKKKGKHRQVHEDLVKEEVKDGL